MKMLFDAGQIEWTENHFYGTSRNQGEIFKTRIQFNKNLNVLP